MSFGYRYTHMLIIGVTDECVLLLVEVRQVSIEEAAEWLLKVLKEERHWKCLENFLGIDHATSSPRDSSSPGLGGSPECQIMSVSIYAAISVYARINVI